MMLHCRDASRSGLTLAEILVASAIVLVLASLVVLASTRTTCRGGVTVQCANNLKQIYAYAVAYADGSGTERFPIAPGKNSRAHESLNDLIASDREGLSPRMFICQLSDGTPAVPDADGRFVLSGSTSSYAWTAEPLDITGAPRPLASDKYADGFEDADGRHSGHRGGMNVLYTDGSVRFVAEKDLDPGTGLPPGLVR